MSSNKELLGIYQMALNQCRTAKLSYLKSADKQHLPEYKRFFNLQATVRNRIYNDLITLVNSKEVELAPSFLHNHNREEIMIATIGSEKQNAFSKAIESDESMIELMIQIMEIDVNSESQNELICFVEKLKNSLQTNRTFEKQSFLLREEKKVS
ncbi:hypothetical protein N8345_03010 [Flavobacteriaceae bacterium]|nr:hypothetical protein [Flavobacteriaceae bacterium]MDC1460820.1 hypothetical protein [Flavobacteriaceae bacterium]